MASLAAEEKCEGENVGTGLRPHLVAERSNLISKADRRIELQAPNRSSLACVSSIWPEIVPHVVPGNVFFFEAVYHAFRPLVLSCGLVDFYSHEHWRNYSNWLLRCPHHPNCMKKRVVSDRSTALHGRVEPLAFLCAWRDVALDPGASAKTHNSTLPSREAVERVVLEHRDALQRCVDHFSPQDGGCPA